jgi:hypothetical protein
LLRAPQRQKRERANERGAVPEFLGELHHFSESAPINGIENLHTAPSGDCIRINIGRQQR